MQDEKTKTLRFVLPSTETMSSREIAELTGKMHKHVLDAIRVMEPAWVKVNGTNFRLVEYLDSKGEKRPQYELSKIECLYIATKFNDEARARLIMRWEQLENSKPKLPSTKELAMMVIRAEEEKERLQVQTQLQQQQLVESAPKVQYYENVLQSESCIPITVIAKELGMSGGALNSRLKRLGVIYRCGKTWVPYSKYQDMGYTKSKTHHYTDEHGEPKTAIHTYWTEKGRKFIIEQIEKMWAKERKRY